MKISNVKIENFRGITAKHIQLDNINIILDDIGKGKTSVLNAIIFGLTGQAELSDIRNGCTDATVILEFENGSTIERCRDKKGTTVRVNGKRTTATAAREYLNTLCGGDVDFLPAMLGVDLFDKSSQKEVTEFFSKILPCSITFDKMLEMINEKRKKEKKNILSDEEAKLLKEYFTDESYGIETIDTVHKKVFDERKVQKKILNNTLPKAKFNGKLPVETKEDLQQKLYNIAVEEAKKNNYQKENAAYQTALKTKETAENNKKSLKAEFEKYKNCSKPDENIVTVAKADRKKFENAIEQSTKIKATAKANIKSFQNILDNLNSSHCVACSDIVCTTDKSCAKKDLEARIADNKKLVDEHDAFIGRCREQIAKRDKKIEDYNANILAFEKKSSLEKQIESIMIPHIPEKPVKPDEKDYNKEKQEVNEKLAVISQYEAAESNRIEAEKVQKKVNFLETAVEVLDVKTGIRTIILQNALSVFEKLCNSKLSSINSNMEIIFKAENGIEILVKTENSNGYIPMHKVSTGQFVLVAYALMCLVGQITKCRYCIIDNIDKLDKKHTELFISLIENETLFDTVILAGVSHSDIKDACGNHSVLSI